MNNDTTRPAGDERKMLIKRLIAAGAPTDSALDVLVGLDVCDVLADGPRLLERRMELGLSAEDIAALATAGLFSPSVVAALEAIPPIGRHARVIAS